MRAGQSPHRKEKPPHRRRDPQANGPFPGAGLRGEPPRGPGASHGRRRAPFGAPWTLVAAHPTPDAETLDAGRLDDTARQSIVPVTAFPSWCCGPVGICSDRIGRRSSRSSLRLTSGGPGGAGLALSRGPYGAPAAGRSPASPRPCGRHHGPVFQRLPAAPGGVRDEPYQLCHDADAVAAMLGCGLIAEAWGWQAPFWGRGGSAGGPGRTVSLREAALPGERACASAS